MSASGSYLKSRPEGGQDLILHEGDPITAASATRSEQAPDKIFPAAHQAISAIHPSPQTIQKIVRL
jgi:hypothetical protein